MAEVHLSLPEFAAINQAKVDAENEAARLRDELAKAQLADPNDVVPVLVDCIRAAREILPFAMMYIPMEKWPLGALQTFADIFEHIPGATPDDQVVAIDLRDFVKEGRDRLAKRATVTAREPLQTSPDVVP